MEGADPGFVYWIERRGRLRGVFLQATPIEVADVLRQHLWDKVDSAVLTSATLAVAGGFDYVKSRLGLEDARTLVVPSHFDYASQALLYIPNHLPNPSSSPAYVPAASLKEILKTFWPPAADAPSFSSPATNKCVRSTTAISLQIEYPVLLQGTGPRTALLEEFRETPNCVLFATSSFWQGVDVPGERLSCVIIDKLPFAGAGADPVVEARMRNVREAGGKPVLRLPDSPGRHRAQAGVRAVDSYGLRSRGARPAR